MVFTYAAIGKILLQCADRTALPNSQQVKEKNYITGLLGNW